MSEPQSDSEDRWPIYHLIIVIALAIAAGRIAVVKSPEGDTAFLSANDRSRWCTVASLVEQGTFAIDTQVAITNRIKRNRRPWDSIDKVRHLGRDGKQHYYSSKPPLLATMVAGVYKVMMTATGMTLTAQPLYLARIILALVNLPLLAIYFYATIASIDRVVRTRWAAAIAAAACCFGTMVLPFAVSLNNHLVACTATAVVMWIYVRAVTPTRSTRSSNETTTQSSTAGLTFKWSLLAGFCAAMSVANELPSLSMAALWFLLFAWLDRKSILPFGIGFAVVAVAFFGTNWIAHQSLRPPYTHRGNGAEISTFVSQSNLPDQELTLKIGQVLREMGISETDAEPKIMPSDEADRWLVLSGETQFALLRSGGQWQLAHWDDWYEYPGTYWRDENRRGVDRGEASRVVYLFNMTIGHHGLFSLTPIWLLTPIGLIAGLRRDPPEMKRLMAAILIASLVCIAFYLKRPLIDRNYGGVSVCFRWLLWFAPMWLLASAPMLDKLERVGWRRWMAIGLLASSVFSVAASLQSPWQSPWIYQFWRFLGWLDV